MGLLTSDSVDTELMNVIYTKPYCLYHISYQLSLLSPAAVCDGCRMMNGVGYINHPYDCTKFVQCFYSAKGGIEAVYMPCPFGQYWDQVDLTCKPSNMVDCIHGKFIQTIKRKLTVTCVIHFYVGFLILVRYFVLNLCFVSVLTLD